MALMLRSINTVVLVMSHKGSVRRQQFQRVKSRACLLHMCVASSDTGAERALYPHRTQGHRTHGKPTYRRPLLTHAWLLAASGARCTSHIVPSHDRCDTRHLAAAARP